MVKHFLFFLVQVSITQDLDFIISTKMCRIQICTCQSCTPPEIITFIFLKNKKACLLFWEISHILLYSFLQLNYVPCRDIQIFPSAVNPLNSIFCPDTSFIEFFYICFIASTSAFNLLTCAFNLPTYAFIPRLRAFSLATRAFSVLTCGFELVTCGIELVTHGFTS